jgi:hypothetical protein
MIFTFYLWFTGLQIADSKMPQFKFIKFKKVCWQLNFENFRSLALAAGSKRQLSIYTSIGTTNHLLKYKK